MTEVPSQGQKFGVGPGGGLPPWKQGQKIDLTIAHWSLWAPRRSGMYETVRELIAAENRIDGVLAGMCVIPPVELLGKRETQRFIGGGLVDSIHPELRTQDWGWAYKFANIHVIHFSFDKKLGKLKPKVFMAHGTPEAVLAGSMGKEGKSGNALLSGAEWINKFQATIVTSQRAKMFWGAFDDTGKKTHVVNKGIDLAWWQRSEVVQDLPGEPSVLYGEVWRGIKHPALLFYAMAELFRRNDKARLNVWALNKNEELWKNFIGQAGFWEFMGQDNLPGIEEYPEHFYSRGDVLVSPVTHGDLSRVAQEAMACFPPGTKIQTLTGLKNIESIQLGELVLSHKGRYCPVTQLYKRSFSGCLSRVVAGDSFISPTPEHPILTEEGWLNGSQIKRSLSGESYGKGRSNLHCWAPRRGGVLLHQDPVSIEPRSRRRIKLSTRSGDGTEPRSPLYTRMAESDLWRLHNAQAKQTRVILGSDRKTPYRFFYGFYPALFEDENRISRHSPKRIKQAIEYRSGAQQLSGLVMVPAPSSENLFNQLETQARKIECFLETFRPIPITSITELRYSGPVYNLGVSFDHSYCANGIIVHNCGCPVVSWDTDPYGENYPYKAAKGFDIIDLADKIEETYNEILDDPETVRKKCRQTAETYYNINDEAKSIVDILRQVVAEQ